MPQLRYPNKTTSVSGIVSKDWNDFQARAKREGISNKEALERAITDLVAAVARNETIIWRPAKTAKARAFKIHDIYHKQLHDLVERLGFRQNVVIGTAIYRWTNRP